MGACPAPPHPRVSQPRLLAGEVQGPRAAHPAESRAPAQPQRLLHPPAEGTASGRELMEAAGTKLSSPGGCRWDAHPSTGDPGEKRL